MPPVPPAPLTTSIPEPVLASTLYTEYLKQQDDANADTAAKLGLFGQASLDAELLDGGFDLTRDKIIGLASPSLSTGCDISSTARLPFLSPGPQLTPQQLHLHLLATHLLSTQSTHGTATWIVPATQIFPAAHLQTILSARLRHAAVQAHLATTAAGLPARSGFGRYDDLLGRLENDSTLRTHSAARELADDAAAQARLAETARSLLERVAVMRVYDFAGAMDAVAEAEERLQPAPAAQETLEVADSQADSPLPWDASPPPQAPKARHLLFLDLSPLLAPLLRTAPTRGQALLVHCARRLRVLAARQGAVCVLGNVTVGGPASLAGGGGRAAAAAAASGLPGPSAFADALDLRPALGRTLPFLLDVSVMVACRLEDRRHVHVVEVVKDRCGRRVGRWVGIGGVGGSGFLETV